MPDIVVAGASGLVGSALVRLLGRQANVHVTALVRRSGALAKALGGTPPANVVEHVFDFTNEASYAAIGSNEIRCDAIFCAIGTTMRQAGTRAAFTAVDYDIPLRLMTRAQKLNPSPLFGLVSSTGAARPVGFYLETKAKVEEALRASGLHYVIVRPSLLLGERQESRLGEGIASRLAPRLLGAASKLTHSRLEMLGRILPIHGDAVAKALASSVLEQLALPAARRTSEILEGYRLHEKGKAGVD